MTRASIAGVLSAASILFLTWRRGSLVGRDHLGNRYYRAAPVRGQPRERRWVVYAGIAEPTLVPPEWHGWLHHQQKDAPAAENRLRQAWQKPPLPSLTGTDQAYRPPGHTLETGRRDRATGDYEPWLPS